MKPIVLDSWALLAYLKGEPAAAAVEQLLQSATDGECQLFLCVVNWGEVYCTMLRAASGRPDADLAMAELAQLPIDLIPVEADLALVRQAAVFKAGHKLAYADAFAAALAKLRKAELVTGDPEFKALSREINIRWLPVDA